MIDGTLALECTPQPVLNLYTLQVASSADLFVTQKDITERLQLQLDGGAPHSQHSGGRANSNASNQFC